MNTLKKIWMNFTHSSLLYQTITKNVLGYFQVNSEILETRISSSSKFVPQKNLSSIFKLNPKRFRNFKYFRTKYFQVICPHYHRVKGDTLKVQNCHELKSSTLGFLRLLRSPRSNDLETQNNENSK